MKRYSQTLVFVLCVGFTIAGFVNTMANNDDVVRLATSVACEEYGDKCVLKTRSVDRTPFSQTVELASDHLGATVVCRRAFILIGAYACSVADAGHGDGPSAPPRPTAPRPPPPNDPYH